MKGKPTNQKKKKNSWRAKAFGGYPAGSKEDCASIVNIKDNYKDGDLNWFFTFTAGTIEGRGSYEIQMRYL